MARVVRVEGAAKLRRRLKDLEGGVNDLKDANAEVADFIATRAAAAAPKRTGALARTIRGNRAASKAVTRAGRATVPYARPIHWGWPARHIKPQRFLWDTAKETEPEWLDTYAQALQRLADGLD